MGKGLDIGTVNLVAAKEDGDDITFTKERNAFIDVQVDNYSKNMLTKLNVPYVVFDNKNYVVGEAAFELANVLNKTTRRPMKDGLISPDEINAMPIMKMIIKNLLGDAEEPGEVCYYSVPGKPVDSSCDVTYHQEVFAGVLRSLGYTPRALAEGHAVVFAELGEDDFTGIGISGGGGMFNVCVSYRAMPALTFSTSRGGDWIDKNVSNVLGINQTRAAMIKEKGADLLNPNGREEEAIAIYYRNLINYTLVNIKERFEADNSMPIFSDPIEIVCAGGTCSAKNFIDVFKDEFDKIDFPIAVKNIRMAEFPLNAVAQGGLLAALSE